MNNTKKIILLSISVILILFIVGGLVLINYTNKPIKIADEVIETLQENTFLKDEFIDDSNTITNNEIVSEELTARDSIEETTSIQVQEEVRSQNNQSNQNKGDNENTQSVYATNKQPQVSTKEQTAVVDTKEQEVTTTQTTSTPSPSANTQPTVVTPSVPAEEFKRNDQMINRIKSIIQNNETDLMKNYGYNIVVDSSIKTLTNQFTFYEDRVINSLRNKFGTIRIYAEDCYKNGQFIMTECYII